tara:strand:- start:463 stop:3477 length:3015 start_codon:yes stop_codon:yes gene_type:complete
MTAPRVNPDFSQQGNSVFENVYIYDTLYANKVEFSDVTDINLDTLRVKTFFAVGNNDKLFNVSDITKRIGINTLNPDRPIVAIGDVGIGGTVDINGGRVGINSDYIDPTGDRVLEVGGSIRIVRDIYDQFNKRGNNTNVLSVDSNGIFWKELSTEVQEGIFLQEEGVEVGQGVSFTNINFMERNSLGILTETLGITSSGTAGLATVFSNDYWGNAIGGNEAVADHNIYRMTNVGIFTNNPLTALQIGTDTSSVVAITSEGNLGIGTTSPSESLVIIGRALISGVTTLASDGGITTTGGDLFVDDGLSVGGAATIGGDLDVNGGDIKTDQTTFNLLNSTVTTLNLGGDATTIEIGKNDATGVISINATKDSTSTTTGALVVDGGVGIAKRLTVDNVSIANTVGVGSTAYFEDEVDIDGTLILNSFIQDVNDSTGDDKDYRLAAVGSGVSWRPSGVETDRTIWVSESGDDNNSGLLEGDAKRTIGAAATVAEASDTIVIRPGTYDENNPIGLRTDVSVTGQDIRLVTIRPQNLMRDIFHVRRGCLIENLNFACKNNDGEFNDNGVSVANTGGAAVAFPPTQTDIDAGTAYQAVSGFTDVGPATEGPTGRWRSPYVRNCTNFMTESVGMKIDGNHATASSDGANLKSMVCDSFTQYNEAGIGVSLTNEAYAQLVSIFTINCDIGIYADTGAQCDLTNSNSSFGNFGLVAVGLGSTQYSGFVTSNSAGVAYDVNNTDIIVGTAVTDLNNEYERPFDGQAVWFAIDFENYPDVDDSITGRLTAPMREVDRIELIPNATGNTGFSAASPPPIIIQDFDDTLVQPKGPQSVAAQATATVSAGGSITEINMINNGRNYLPSQNIVVDINGDTGIATAVMKPIYFTVSEASESNVVGMTTITFNEFIPYELFEKDPIYFARISRILTSSHSFEYIGTGTTINSALPFEGGIPIKANEVDARDGAQIPFTSTDQKGNFDIGEGIQIDQTTSTIRGRDFSRSVQAEITPLILALN